MRCSRCDALGHNAAECPHFRRGREDHADADWGDNVPHLNQMDITISANGEIMQQNRLEVGWWDNHSIEIAVDNIYFVLGRASGEGCNCLIDSLKQILPTSMFDVAFVRQELERRHAGRPTAIVRRDYLDLAIYWADVIDIIGMHNLQGVIPDFSSRFRICCVDMCWIGNGEVVPRGVPQGHRETLYIARVNQNHFVPLLRSRRRGGEIPRRDIGENSREASSSVACPPGLEAASEAEEARPLHGRSEDVQEAQEQARREAEEARELQGREADAARIQQQQEQERRAMQAADIEATFCRDSAGEAAAAAPEPWETAARMCSGEASTRDAEKEILYGMDAIMAGTAYEEGWEDAEASIGIDLDGEETKHGAGSAQDAKRRSKSTLDEAELERLQQEQRERRRRTDMLSQLNLCTHRPRKHWFEQRLEGADQLAKKHLRSRVTISANLEKDPNSQALIDSAMSLHRIHCAFTSCTGSFEEVFKEDEEKVRALQKESESLDEDPHAEVFWDRVLKEHIVRQHKDEIREVALVEEDADVWDVYKEALAVQERQRVPVVGAAVDRRAFQTTLEVYKDDSIRSLICFVCARVCLHTDGAHSAINYRRGAWLLNLPTGIYE